MVGDRPGVMSDLEDALMLVGEVVPPSAVLDDYGSEPDPSIKAMAQALVQLRLEAAENDRIAALAALSNDLRRRGIR